MVRYCAPLDPEGLSILRGFRESMYNMKLLELIRIWALTLGLLHVDLELTLGLLHVDLQFHFLNVHCKPIMIKQPLHDERKIF